jgi:hypothetical protein
MEEAAGVKIAKRTPTTFHLHRSETCQEKTNAVYPFDEEVADETTLKRVVDFDHTMSKHRGGHRSTEDFLEADVLIMDVDESKRLDDFESEFSEIEHYVATSRHHQLAKDGKPPMDRFHVYFPIPLTEDQGAVQALLDNIHAKFPFVCEGAKKSAQFFFGNPNAIVHYTSGDKLITEIVGDPAEQACEDPPPESETKATSDHAYVDPKNYVHGVRHRLYRSLIGYQVDHSDAEEDDLVLWARGFNSTTPDPFSEEEIETELVPMIKDFMKRRRERKQSTVLVERNGKTQKISIQEFQRYFEVALYREFRDRINGLYRQAVRGEFPAVYDLKSSEFVSEKALRRMYCKEVFSTLDLVGGIRKYRLCIDEWLAQEPTYRGIMMRGGEERAITEEGQTYWNVAGRSADQAYEFLSDERLAAVYDRICEDSMGCVSTGYEGWDDMLGGGFRKRGYYLIVAQTSVGKSAFTQNLAVRQAAAGKRVLLATTEMSRDATLIRLMEIHFDLPFTQLGDVLKSKGTGDLFKNINVRYLGKGQYSADALRAMFRPEYDIVLIDGLDDLVSSRRAEQEWVEQGIIGQDLDRLATEFNAPVVTVTWTNRKANDDKGDIPENPTITDLGASIRKANQTAATFGVAAYNSLGAKYRKIYFKKNHRYSEWAEGVWFEFAPHTTRLNEVKRLPFADPHGSVPKRGSASVGSSTNAATIDVGKLMEEIEAEDDAGTDTMWKIREKVDELRKEQRRR